MAKDEDEEEEKGDAGREGGFGSERRKWKAKRGGGARGVPERCPERG